MGTYYSADLFTGMPIWFSDYFLGNLRTILQSDFLSTYRNSVIVSFCSVFFSVFTSVTIGYSIAKFKFRLKKIFLAIILLGMMMPTQISIIGYVIEMRVFHWSNTLMAVICVWIANPFSAFFMAQFIKDSVPDELLESARMDGCSEPGILARIVFPCIRSGVMTIATLVFLWSWNNYLLPLIILNKDSVYTLPLMISNIGAAYQHDYGAQMLALSLSTFPVLIIFSFGSKYFIKGITAGAIKA
ncbi:MAG: carbohydrate ABC transporter permease [Eubacteriales bacterium]|nr:carbohydrate ABC transporter permease [Eubacteriales bacterium]